MRTRTNACTLHRFKHSSLFMLVPVALISTTAKAAEIDVIVTDRPDFVESSDVVGKGRFQLETGINLERNNRNGIKDKVSTTPLLLRLGTGDIWELRIETEGRTILKSEDTVAATSSTVRGYSDVSLGAKWHVMDDHGAMPSVGILANVDLDSGSSAFRGNGLRPSVRVVAEWDLPGDMSLGIMPGLVYDKTPAGQRFYSGIFGIVLGKSWNDRFRTFVEVAASQVARAKNGGSVVTADIGAAYLLSNLCQIDMSLFKGLNKNTADLTWGVGVSVKF
jgi:hypothetical protein